MGRPRKPDPMDIKHVEEITGFPKAIVTVRLYNGDRYTFENNQTMIVGGFKEALANGSAVKL